MVKYTFLMLSMSLGFTSSLFASEQPIELYETLNKPVEIWMNFDSNKSPLYYVSKTKTEYLKQLKLNVSANIPCFISCHYASKDLRTDLPGLLEKEINILAEKKSNTKEDYKQCVLLKNSIRLQEITKRFESLKDKKIIPLTLFISSSGELKKAGDILYSFTENIDGSDILFNVKFGNNFASELTARGIIAEFCNNKPSFMEDDRDELRDAEIIYSLYKGDQKVSHGNKSYKVELERLAAKKIVEEQIKQQQDQRETSHDEYKQAKHKAFWQSLIKRGLCAGALGLVGLYFYVMQFHPGLVKLS